MDPIFANIGKIPIKLVMSIMSLCRIYIDIYSYSSEFPQHGIVAEALLIASEKSNKIPFPNERDSVSHERPEA